MRSELQLGGGSHCQQSLQSNFLREVFNATQDDCDDGDDDGDDDDDADAIHYDGDHHEQDDHNCDRRIFFNFQNLLAEGTHDWGVKVERVEVSGRSFKIRSDQIRI